MADDRTARYGRGMDQLGASVIAGTPDALAGATSVVERIAEDEAAARDERARLETYGLLNLDPQPAIDGLRDGEIVVDVRQATRVERIPAGDTGEITGRLHLTTRRLILSGAAPLEVELSAIEELSLIGERLLVGLGNGGGLSFDIAAPRVFRVRAAYAIAQTR
jgi:hypothetical protein